MGLLNKLFGKRGGTTAERDEAASVHCPHTALTPRWDSVEDMGNEDTATGYQCQACGENFSPAEGHALRRSEAERAQSVLKV
jgi:methionyl-tRNA synthetase